jgi:inositol transport system substrate-binding protein
MRSMNRRQVGFALVGVLAIVGMAPLAASAKDKFTVGYINLADSDVWLKKLKTDFANAAKADPSLDIAFADANGDVNKQLDQIDNFIAQKVDAIVVLPVDYDGIVPGVEKANAAGIPVISLAIRSHGGKFAYVGSSNLDAGRLQGKFMHDHLPKNAQIVYLQGTLGLYHSNERYKGFTEALDRPDVKILAVQSGDYDRAKGMAITEDWIQSFPKFDGIVAANDQMALGALQALKAADRKGVLISGIDGLQDTLKAVADGDIAHTVFQNATAQAKAAVQVIEDMKAGKPAPGETIVPFEPITKENVAKYMN